MRADSDAITRPFVGTVNDTDGAFVEALMLFTSVPNRPVPVAVLKNEIAPPPRAMVGGVEVIETTIDTVPVAQPVSLVVR